MSSDASAVDRTISKWLFIVIDQWLNKLVTDKFLQSSRKIKTLGTISGKTVGLFLILRGRYNCTTDGDQKVVVIGDGYQRLAEKVSASVNFVG